MKNYEFYIKYKTNYKPMRNQAIYKTNWWQLTLLAFVAVLIGPLIIYKRLGSVSFSVDFYLQVLEYCSFVAVPFVSFLVWVNWREELKRKRGYDWVGKFEVIKKQSALFFCFLQLAPGHSRLRVERSLFESLRVGNFVEVRRDSLGRIEEVRRVHNFPVRLAGTSTQKTKTSS